MAPEMTMTRSATDERKITPFGLDDLRLAVELDAFRFNAAHTRREADWAEFARQNNIRMRVRLTDGIHTRIV